MEYNYIINSKETEVDVEGSASEMSVSLDEKTSKVSVIPVNEGLLLMRVNGKSYPVHYARNEQGLHVMVKGVSIVAQEPGESGNSGMADYVELVDGKLVLVAPMPGQVVKVNVNVGDEVAMKQCCVIVEAMKMENELITSIDGTVSAVHVEAGQKVDALQPLVEVTQKDGEE
jgi:biotin carboxyl carrier protein